MTRERMTAKQRRQCIKGVEALLDLGFTQAQLARMFDANTATINQWIRYGRVGKWLVGRIVYIPELLRKTSISTLRPDLEDFDVRHALDKATAWYDENKARINARPKEVPGARLNAMRLSPLSKKYRARRAHYAA